MTTATQADFLAETADLLRRTPDVLRALLAGLPESWGDTPDKDGGWRPRDVVGHLTDAVRSGDRRPTELLDDEGHSATTLQR